MFDNVIIHCVKITHCKIFCNYFFTYLFVTYIIHIRSKMYENYFNLRSLYRVKVCLSFLATMQYQQSYLA